MLLLLCIQPFFFSFACILLRLAYNHLKQNFAKANSDCIHILTFINVREIPCTSFDVDLNFFFVMCVIFCSSFSFYYSAWTEQTDFKKQTANKQTEHFVHTECFVPANIVAISCTLCECVSYEWKKLDDIFSRKVHLNHIEHMRQIVLILSVVCALDTSFMCICFFCCLSFYGVLFFRSVLITKMYAPILKFSSSSVYTHDCKQTTFSHCKTRES